MSGERTIDLRFGINYLAMTVSSDKIRDLERRREYLAMRRELGN